MTTNFLYFGNDSVVYPLAKIIHPENIFLEDKAIISDFCFILASKYIKIGKYAHLAPYSMITGGGEVTIGNFVEISYGAKIISGTDDILVKIFLLLLYPLNLEILIEEKLKLVILHL